MKIRILMFGCVMGIVAVTGCSTSSTPGPMTSFGNGTFKVGRDVDDIQAGKYETKGPPANSPDHYCVWKQAIADDSGNVVSLIDEEAPKGPDRVTVHTGETFSTAGGCHWKLVK